MATPRKTATKATKKSAPKSAKEIHQDRVTRNAIEEAELAAAIEPTSAAEWKSKQTARKLKLPSGYTALVRNPGMNMFIEQGMIPNKLLKIVMAAVDENKPPSQRVLKEVSTDPEDVKDIIELTNNVTLACVIMPRVLPAPKFTETDVANGVAETEQVGQVIPVGHPSRDVNKLYVDEVDLEDKMFIFQWVVGGTHDLDSFREQQNAAVADLSPGAVMEQAAQ